MTLARFLGAIAPPAAPAGDAAPSDPKTREIRRTAAFACGGDMSALLKLYALDARLALQVENELAAQYAEASAA